MLPDLAAGVAGQQEQLGHAELTDDLGAQDGRSVVEEDACDDAVLTRGVLGELGANVQLSIPRE